MRAVRRAGQPSARQFVCDKVTDDRLGDLAGLAMGPTALATALIAPWLAPRLIGLLG